MNVFIKIGVPTWQEAESWGDYHFAKAVSRELVDKGHRCQIQVLKEWNSNMDKDSDVTIHIKGLSRYSPKKGCLNVIWIISHPDKVTRRELKKYDLVLVASVSFAEKISEWVDAPVVPLLQFADCRVMYPDVDPDHSCDLLFLGNSRKVNRQILKDLLPCPYNLHVWGSDWNAIIPPEYVKGRYFPYNKARRLYSSARIVLNDHWPDMKTGGFINNRVFDALACRAFVISDRCAGMEHFFEDGLVAYEGRDELNEKIDLFINSEPKRTQVSDIGYKKVASQHTVGHRVDELLHFIAKAKPPKDKKRKFFFLFRTW